MAAAPPCPLSPTLEGLPVCLEPLPPHLSLRGRALAHLHLFVGFPRHAGPGPGVRLRATVSTWLCPRPGPHTLFMPREPVGGVAHCPGLSHHTPWAEVRAQEMMVPSPAGVPTTRCTKDHNGVLPLASLLHSLVCHRFVTISGGKPTKELQDGLCPVALPKLGGVPQPSFFCCPSDL